MNSPNVIMEWLKILGITLPLSVIIALFLIGFGLSHLESFLAKLYGLVAWIGPSVRKSSIKKEVRAKVLASSKALNNEIGAPIIPYDLQIQWVKEESADSFIQNNQVVVLMKYSNNRAENVVKAITHLVSCGLITEAKNHIDISLSKSLDLVVIRKLIDSSYNDTMPYFRDKVMNPLVNSDPEIKATVEALFEIDGAGLLTQIFIRELMEKAYSLCGNPPDEALKLETRQFVQFLYNIATRKSGGPPIDLSYVSEYYKVSAPIVGLKETLMSSGVSRHIIAIKNALDNGAENIYVLCGSAKFSSLNEIQNIMKSDVRIKDNSHFSYTYRLGTGKKAKGICYRLSTHQSTYNAYVELAEAQ